jgi:FG-GAP-like repeat
MFSKPLRSVRSEFEAKPKRLFLPATLLSGFLFLAAASSPAAPSVTLAWNASSGPNVAGYRVHEGTSTRAYTTSIDAGKATTATISNLTAGRTYRTGNPQIIWYTGSNTYIAWSITWSGSHPTTAATSFSLPTNFPTLAIADFDGDGLQDVVQWNASSSKLSIAKNNGSLNFTQQYSVVVTHNWDLIGVADLNGDGKHELVWRNQITGQVSAWVMNKFQPAQYPAYSSPSLSWRIRGIGKVDASSAQGLIWRNENTGQTSFWKLNTNGQVSNPVLPVGAAPWEIVGAPYFDGRNGLPEILWYNTQTGAVTIWRVSGTSVSCSSVAVPGTQWTIQPAVIGD